MKYVFISVLFSIILCTNFASANDLHSAVLANNLDKITLLIKKGKDVNEINEEGQWPLLICATYGLDKAAVLLIDNGANINMANIHGYTAFHEAASLGYRDIIKVFLKYKGDFSKRDINHYNVLNYAQMSGSESIVRLLKRHGATE